MKLSDPILIDNQPVIMNYRFKAAEEAASVPLRPIALKECSGCGLVFNSAFEESVVPYDELYENRQSHSEAFAKHISQVARIIGAVVNSKAPRILEVGCGKGEFLKFVVDYCGGTGEGWDTSYEGALEEGRVSFHKSYLTPATIRGTFDAVVCRHVIVQVRPIGRFLFDLAKIVESVGQPTVFIETPRLEWILENRSAWDIFYEHCNYFTEKALAALCRRVGFQVLGQFPVFSRQYQLIVLEMDKNSSIVRSPSYKTGEEVINQLREMQEGIFPMLASSIEKKRNGALWAIWGAGAKGVCLANRLPNENLARVIDTNMAKQGFYIPGTRIPIVAPSSDHLRDLGLVVIANPTYEGEIKLELERVGYSGNVLVLHEKIYEDPN
jgi:2-polyprenyl-3-methyl-5-hydroxy-6-metoxy-1,4-benzoquinol methylase